MKNLTIKDDYNMTQWAKGENINGLVNGEQYVCVLAADDQGNEYNGYCKQISTDSAVEPCDCIDWDNIVIVS